ncbi:MAG: 30S ribosomal protein S1 [Paludibacteraceae bacterium]|nr:30S ribosomal protein S1 [Paludibacteraceae bacterium]
MIIMADVKPLENFDWDAYQSGAVENTGMTKDELIQKYDNTLNSLKEGEVVEGTVVAIDKREVTVNINSKSFGYVNVAEFRYNPELKPGDKVEVYVESQENKDGQVILSHRKAIELKAWDNIKAAYEKDEIVKGYIKTRTRGGMIVEVLGLEAFLPGSQIDTKPIRDYDVFLNKTMEFKIVKINEEARNVVISHKAIIEAELDAQRQEIISHLQKGQVLEGTVKNILHYGVFVDLGGIDGLVHITDLSWGRVSDPKELVSLDEKIKVVILEFDAEKSRIQLGMKQLTPNPWDELDPHLVEGAHVRGKVAALEDYGAFIDIRQVVDGDQVIDIKKGYEGLVHVTEMSYTQRLRTASEFVKIGDEVEAVILSIAPEEHRMSLGIKQLKPDPWENIEERYPIGSRVMTKVRNFTNFGVFVEVEEGVDGLVNIKDLSWTKKIKHPNEFTKIGADLEVVVLDINKERHNLYLGHKQLEENPWDAIEADFQVGSEHEGKVANVTDKGAFVTFENDVEAFCPTHQLQKEDGTQATTGEVLKFRVTEFNKEWNSIRVSHLRTWEAPKEEPKRAKKEAAPAADQKLEKTTLGDLDALAALKKQMEEEKPAKKAKKAAKAEEKTEE